MIFQQSSRDFWQVSHFKLHTQTMQFFGAIQALGAAGVIPALLSKRLRSHHSQEYSLLFPWIP